MPISQDKADKKALVTEFITRGVEHKSLPMIQRHFPSKTEALTDPKEIEWLKDLFNPDLFTLSAKISSIKAEDHQTTIDRISKENSDTHTNKASGHNILHLAAEHFPEAIPYLMQHPAAKTCCGVKSSPTLDLPAHTLLKTQQADTSETILALLLPKARLVNMTDQQGRTPLHLAAQYAPHLIPFLLALGAKPDVYSQPYSFSPLLYLLNGSHHKQTKASIGFNLMNQNMIKHAETYQNRTPLHFAATFCPPLILPMINAGADIDHLDNRQASPLHQLLSQKSYAVHDEEINALIYPGSIHLEDAQGNTPLYYAVENHPNTILHLLASGVESNLAHELQQNPLILYLYLTLEHDTNPSKTLEEVFHLSHAKKLMTLDNLEYTDSEGQTLLHHAAEVCPKLIAPLVDAGADPEHIDHHLNTPLMVLLLNNPPENLTAQQVEILTTHHNMILYNERGNAPIHYAAERHPQWMLYFLAHGAQLDHCNINKSTPLTLLLSQPATIERKAIVDEVMMAYIQSVEQGTMPPENLATVNQRGYTALMYAAIHYPKWVNALIKLSPDFMHIAPGGNSLFHFLAKHPKYLKEAIILASENKIASDERVSQLLNLLKLLNQKNHAGNTVLHALLKNCNQTTDIKTAHHEDILLALNELLPWCTDDTKIAANGEGQTPLHLAVQSYYVTKQITADHVFYQTLLTPDRHHKNPMDIATRKSKRAFLLLNNYYKQFVATTMDEKVSPAILYAHYHRSESLSTYLAKKAQRAKRRHDHSSSLHHKKPKGQ